MRRSIIAVALAAGLVTGWATTSEAQQSGIVIQNNGVDSVDSAAGADNVRVSQNPGASQSVNAAGLNNEVGTAREKERNRKDRSARNAGEEIAQAAPVEAAPVEGDYQTYGEPGTVPVETQAEPAAAPQEAAPPAAPEAAVIRLPSTGSGSDVPVPFWSLLAGIAAVAAGVSGLRRRLLN